VTKHVRFWQQNGHADRRIECPLLEKEPTCRSAYFMSTRLMPDCFWLNQRRRLSHLAPLAGRGRIASAMPTGRANARPMTGSQTSGAIRVRGTLRALASFEFAEAAPHPNPPRATSLVSTPQERGEGGQPQRITLQARAQADFC
jgi:hypothetical protein